MSLDTPVRRVLRLPRAAPGALQELKFGIELEYENMPDAHMYDSPRLWRMEGDGSLRNAGVEFVSNVLGLDEVEPALDELDDFLQNHDPDPSERCGLHVHMNCRHLTIGQLYSLLTAYVLVEPAVFARYCPDRITSSFCVPVFLNGLMCKHAHTTVQQARVRSAHNVLNLLVGTSKYSALNVRSLGQFGTVEFRQLPSTADLGAVQEWIERLTHFHDAAIAYTDPLQVLEAYEGTSAYDFQRTMIGFTRPISRKNRRQMEKMATLLAGHNEPRWDQLNWNTPQETE